MAIYFDIYSQSSMARINYSTDVKWEAIIGYSRAVKMGDRIEITGTTAVEEDRIIGEGDAYAQAACILNKIKIYLEELGASMEDVIRTRMYVTDISLWEEVGRAHYEYFGEIKPATSMVEVSALIDPRMLVEIEATAIKSE